MIVYPITTISPLELQEYLFASTDAQVAAKVWGQTEEDVVDQDSIRDHIRGSYRCHRFAVINWLMMNGVTIPARLICDEMHPDVGKQYADRAVQPTGESHETHKCA